MTQAPPLTAREVAGRVNRRETSAVEVARAALDRIGKLNGRLNAFITATPEEALADAARVDRAVASGERLPLAGVPLAVKDGFWVKGTRCTNGSKLLADFVPGEDAEAVARLRKAGCVVVGKANMHEFAYGFTSRNPHYGDCKNPWDETRVPGGSSGGNAVALATGMALGAVGGDTGGSIRQPAALCGVVGLKVTYGRVSRHGGLPLSWSMDTVGPMARTVGDVAALLQVMAGHDPKDPTTRSGDLPDYLAAAGEPRGPGKPLAGIRVGVPHTGLLESTEPDVGAAIQGALGVLKDAGASLVEVDFPPLGEVVGAHRAILFSEASAAHEDLIRRRGHELSGDVRVLLESGLFLTATQYLGAQQARANIVARYRRLWTGFDVLATATSPIVATGPEATTHVVGGKETPLVRLYLDATLPFNLTGQPALSLPCGFTKAGLPVGLQLVGRPFEEATLLLAGAAYERATDWHARMPPVVAGL